jgi:multidrug efflux pump subunit AcrA (membrane-fusion protein)
MWRGRSVRTDAAVDRDTRLIYATAEVSDPYAAAGFGSMPMAVGLFVNAEIEGVNAQSVMVLPRVALRNNDKVYVINADSKLEIRTVDVLSTTDERVLVTGGVSNGEQVVTSPLPAAVNGMQVQAIQPEVTS